MSKDLDSTGVKNICQVVLSKEFISFILKDEYDLNFKNNVALVNLYPNNTSVIPETK